MQYQYPHLCASITIAGVTFRNRMFSAPMGGTDITNDGCIGPKSTAFYELRAKGGAGAVTVSECMVHPATDGSHAYHLDESILNSLAAATYTADAIRRHGAMPSLELSHSGMYSGTYMTDKTKQHGMAQWGPSACTRPDGVEVGELTKEMIADIVKAYGHVAGLAKRAGFEMLMIHGGHGWLINQFFSPYFNKRTDEYGGCLENRCRFAIEVLKAVREAVGPRFPIEFRMSGSELFEGGYDLEEGCRIAQQIEPYIDLLHVSAGTYQRGFGDTHPSMFKEHGCNVYLAAEIKKHVKVPVATIGGLNDPAQMEEIIASGKADIVYMARALLADPFLPNKVMANRGDEIVRCLRCFTCMAERAATSTRRCTVNPLIGRELEGDTIYPAPEKKKVLVAGGGPGGLYAAYTAARRGHQVILCEKDAELGGILKSEQALPFKQEMYQLAGTYANLARKAGVEIRLNTAVTPELVAAEAPDASSSRWVPRRWCHPFRASRAIMWSSLTTTTRKKTRSPTMWWSLAAGSRAASALSTSARRASVSTSSRCGMSWPPMPTCATVRCCSRKSRSTSRCTPAARAWKCAPTASSARPRTGNRCWSPAPASSARWASAPAPPM